jgi:uncharacterized protein YndB with AHSA1/START domain
MVPLDTGRACAIYKVLTEARELERWFLTAEVAEARPDSTFKYTFAFPQQPERNHTAERTYLVLRWCRESK